ncbi:MAG: methionyl-tRNA formyltransferase [Helicobacter sp.]|nr:methionyl-tRNA formyltransferase [Helicobacter sp.]
MDIIFMGTPFYATVILEALLQHHQVKALVSQGDKRSGRSLRIKMPPTKELILKKGINIPIFQTFDEAVFEELEKISCDMIIVAAFGRILPRRILQRFPCINLHASILPKFRGASPIQASILKDEPYFGVSVMKMEEGLDCGDILGMKVIKNKGQDSVLLLEELSKLAASLILEFLQRKNIVALKQLECESSYCKKIKKEFGEVAFQDAKEMVLKSLAYEGWPGIFLKNGLKMKGLTLEEMSSVNQAGKILKVTQERILVGAKRGSVWIEFLQASSKSMVSAYQYLQGKRLKEGDFIE